MATGHHHPVGAAHADDIRNDHDRDPEYRREWERQAFAFEIARAVYGRRTDLGISQEELARRVGTTASAISRIESGRHTARIDTLQRIATALDAQLVVRLEPEPVAVAG